jgi:CRP-like cAMP-binding protein
VALDKLSVLIKQVKFFRDMNDLSRSDMRDLASHFKFEFKRGMDYVMHIGDYGDKFYIVLRGVLSV